MPVTHCGMVEGVVAVAAAVSETLRGSASSCGNPPWFCKQLRKPSVVLQAAAETLRGSASSCVRAATTADIDIRICADYYLANEDTPIELDEIYIQ